MTTKTITRNDIIDEIIKSIKIVRTTAVEILEAVLEEIESTIINNGGIKISSFGTFMVRDKNSRIGRNPKNGTEAVITPRSVLIFRPSQYLRLAVCHPRIKR